MVGTYLGPSCPPVMLGTEGRLVNRQGHGCECRSHIWPLSTFCGCQHHNQGIQTGLVARRGMWWQAHFRNVNLTPSISHSTARSFALTCITVAFLISHRGHQCPKTEHRLGQGQMKYTRLMCQRCGSLGVTLVRFWNLYFSVRSWLMVSRCRRR